jgi:hypothetical protein
LSFKRLKPNRRVHVVALDGFAGVEIAVEVALDGLAQKRLTEFRVRLRSRPDGFFEVMTVSAALL